MAGEWRESTVGEEVDILLGFAFKSAEFANDLPGDRLVRGDNVKRGTLEWGEKSRFWRNLTPDLEKYRLTAGDIVVGMDGSRVGENFARVSPEDLPALLVQRVACLRAKENVDQGFLRYLICNPAFTAYIKAVHTGTSIPHISGGQIGSYPILVPPLDEQRAIAHILGTLDDKIELNRRINETLEAMARALFKSWFVDFDPVRLPAASRDAAQAGGLPKPLAGLFPDSFEDSELGEIPKGWTAKPLPEVIDVNPTRSLRKGVTAPYLDMANMPTRGHSPDDIVERAFGSGMRFINGDTLVARITPCLENGKTAFVDFLEEGQVGWGSTEYIVLRPKLPLPEEFAYCLARSNEFRAFAIQSMTGSSGRQRVPAESLSHYLLAVPPEKLAKRFGTIVKPLFERASAVARESRALAALRDSLLPKLITGEISLSKPSNEHTIKRHG